MTGEDSSDKVKIDQCNKTDYGDEVQVVNFSIKWGPAKRNDSVGLAMNVNALEPSSSLTKAELLMRYKEECRKSKAL